MKGGKGAWEVNRQDIIDVIKIGFSELLINSESYFLPASLVDYVR